tara:strand:- start:9278 stop:10240 length:963 start_codon:yes stop_codon:yes gene_type:complete
MKFGVVLPMIGSLASTEAVDAVCDKAEEVGLDSIWVIDHILLPYSIGAKYPYNLTGEWMAGQGPWWDAFSILSYAAARTSTVQLGTCVIILPYRHPVHTAKIVATIDQLSRGRLQFGIGVGWMKDEFENLQLDSFHHRGALVNEQIKVFKEVWANDPASFDGSYYRFNEVSVTPRPYQRPHPPILVGGNSEAALERTASLCDGWLGISLRPKGLAEHRARLLQTCEEQGRSGSDMPIAMLHGITLVDDPDYRATLSHQERSQGVVGTIEQCVEELREFEDSGLTHMIASARRLGRPGGGIQAVLEGIDTLANEIIPAVRS